jgi:hypothetical protein
MKFLAVLALVFSFNAFSMNGNYAQNLSEMYQTLEEVPFLHDNNRLLGIPASEFKFEYYRSTVGDHGIVYYGAYIPSSDEECKDEDYFGISLYVENGNVKFALPLRSYACHED